MLKFVVIIFKYKKLSLLNLSENKSLLQVHSTDPPTL